MNTLGHTFYKNMSRKIKFDDIKDKIEFEKDAGYYYCKICGINIYYYKHMDKIVYTDIKFPTTLDISCNEQQIKNLLE